jgi:hypothetical protein
MNGINAFYLAVSGRFYGEEGAHYKWKCIQRNTVHRSRFRFYDYSTWEQHSILTHEITDSKKREKYNSLNAPVTNFLEAKNIAK